MNKNRIKIFAICCSVLVLPPLSAQISMVDVALDVGVDHQFAEPFVHGGGVSFFDFNNDGWDDLSFTTNGDSIHFYMNMGGTFERVDLGIGLTGEIKQILWVDQDNDGDQDLFVTQYLESNHLFENDGNMEFTDITASAGLLLQAAPTFGACWGDVDNDGFLDLYVTNRVDDLWPFCNYLYLNNGDDTFTNITWTAGVSDSLKMPFLAAFFDYDRDLLLDLYIPQDKYFGNTMFHNSGGNQFVNVSLSTMSNLAMNAMSAGVEDFDANGYPDVYITNTSQGNKLLKNSGNGAFAEVADLLGVEFGVTAAWGANWLDLENDGDLDLHICSEAIALPDTQYSFYEQMGNGYFERPYMVHSYDTIECYGSAIGDLNNDGLVDVAISSGAPSLSKLLVNNSSSGSWLSVDLEGTFSNRDGVGSIIETWVNGNYQARYTLCGESYISQNSGTEFFGFGSDSKIDSIHVVWPSGIIDRFYEVDVDQKLYVIEGSTGIPTGVPASPTGIGFSVYPNITDAVLYIEMDQTHTSGNSFSIFDMNGRAVASYNSDNSTGRMKLDVSELPSGQYLVRSSAHPTFFGRFVKIDR